MLGFLHRHCAEVASHMFELAVLVHASFTPHKDGKSPVCELEMLAVSTSTLNRNGDSRVCQRMRRMLGRDTFEPFHARTQGTGIGSSCVVAPMCEMQLFLGYAWDSIWSLIHGGMSLQWNEHTSSVFGAPNNEAWWLTPRGPTELHNRVLTAWVAHSLFLPHLRFLYSINFLHCVDSYS